MKRKVIILVMILLFIAIFSGCSKANQHKSESNGKTGVDSDTVINLNTDTDTDIENVTFDETDNKGMYIEKKMAPPILDRSVEKTIDIITNQSGNMEYYTYQFNEDTNEIENVYCYTYKNYGYEKETVDWIKSAAIDFGMNPYHVSNGEDGNTYLVLIKIEENTNSRGSRFISWSRLIKEGQDGGYIDVTPSSWTDKNGDFFDIGVRVQHFCVTKDQILCFQVIGRLFFYDLVKQQEVTMVPVPINTNGKFYIIDNTLYYIPNYSHEVVVKDLLTQKEERIKFNKAGTDYNIFIMDKAIYLLDINGIHQYKNGATMWETIVDGSIFSMKNSNFIVKNFVVCPGTYNQFFVNYSNYNETPVLFAGYIYDETASIKFSKEITVYSLWNNNEMREAIYGYMTEHTDTKINYIVATMDSAGATLDDLIHTLNTQILAGKGADVLLLDDLPIESYIQKGALMDMSDFMKEWISDGTLNSNIASNYLINDKIYCMPMRFYIPLFYKQRDFKYMIESVEQLAKLSMNLNVPLFDSYDYDKIIYLFLTAYSEELFNEDLTLNKDKLKTFLTSIQTIGNQIGSKVKDTNINNQRFIQILLEKGVDILEKKVSMSMGIATDMLEFIGSKVWVDQRECTYTTVNDTYIPSGLVGINRVTKNEEVAKDFIKYLFSMDVQEKHLKSGFPVNLPALNGWGEEPFKEQSLFGTRVLDEDGSRIDLVGTDMTVEEKREVINFVKTITTPIYSDAAVINMITDGALSYLDGKKNLDQAASEIMDNVNLYLSE